MIDNMNFNCINKTLSNSFNCCPSGSVNGGPTGSILYLTSNGVQANSNFYYDQVSHDVSLLGLVHGSGFDFVSKTNDPSGGQPGTLWWNGTSLFIVNAEGISETICGCTGGIPNGTIYGQTIHWNNLINSYELVTSNIGLGGHAGEFNQQENAIGFGFEAGQNIQGTNAIAIGVQSGQSMQGISAIAIGLNAGSQTQGSNSVAIGNEAGNVLQKDNCVAIGTSAGNINQSTASVAIGQSAGMTSQGLASVAIGAFAGETNQHINSIVLSALGTSLNTATQNAFYVAPIRNDTTVNTNNKVLNYNPTTREILTSNDTIFNDGDVTILGANLNIRNQILFVALSAISYTSYSLGYSISNAISFGPESLGTIKNIGSFILRRGIYVFSLNLPFSMTTSSYPLLYNLEASLSDNATTMTPNIIPYRFGAEEFNITVADRKFSLRCSCYINTNDFGAAGDTEEIYINLFSGNNGDITSTTNANYCYTRIG
jgi:hypothetical protein